MLPSEIGVSARQKHDVVHSFKVFEFEGTEAPAIPQEKTLRKGGTELVGNLIREQFVFDVMGYDRPAYIRRQVGKQPQQVGSIDQDQVECVPLQKPAYRRDHPGRSIEQDL